MTDVQKLTNNKEIIAYLAEKFPLCFSVAGEAKPLKIGLFQELAEALKDDERVSKTQLRQAIRAYTNNWRYLHACREGAERVDLQGQPCGVIEQEQAEHAATQLAESKAKVTEKKAAEKALNANKKRPRFVKKENKTNVAKSVRKDKINLTAVDFSQLTEGSLVKVKVGDKANNAVVVELSKESARVQLNNGLIISVTPDRLFN
ncbi:RNA chaperone ProQ [[Haemophilus] felis]|nr:RNA chaperone ProQ [[Haemophilus] felis]